jgi:hypothetical protein
MTYQAWDTNEIAIVVHHVGAFLVLVGSSFLVCSPRRIECDSIQRAMAVETIGDLVLWGRLESLLGGVFESCNRASFGVMISFCIDGVIWALMVVMEDTCIVQAINDIWSDKKRTASVSGAMAVALSALLSVRRVICVPSSPWLYWLVLEFTRPVDRRHRRRAF